MTGTIGIAVDFANDADIPWLVDREHEWVTAEFLEAKIGARELLIARLGLERAGWLRFSLFWSQVPFIDLIWVESPCRRRGVGRALLACLEGVARERGRDIVMSSSQSDELEPQAWHEHVGFRRAGSIDYLGKLQLVPEIVFVKEVVTS